MRGSRWLLPFAAVYAAGAAAHRAWRRRLPRWDREVPVVLVGNLTVGGTGKTPLAAWVAAELRRAGWRPAVVSRGYGGTRDRDPLVVGTGGAPRVAASAAGDEPWMLARTLRGVGVVVGTDRVAACALAVDRLKADALVLDDAFQQRDRFPGAYRICAVNAADPFGNGLLLPAGPLREPARALREAHAVVATHVADVRALLATLGRLRRQAPRALFATASHDVGALDGLGGGAKARGWLRGRKVLALAAIGYPEGFAAALRRAGARIMAARFERDHHRWTPAEARDAAREAAMLGCAAVVTTAKDAARLPARLPGTLPWLAARLNFRVATGEEDLRRALRRHVSSR